MEGIVRISTSLSEPWVAWTMLVLLIFLGFANKFQPGLIHQSFSSLFSVKERDSLFEQTTSDIRGQICQYVYLLGVMAFVLYLLFFTSGDFSFVRYVEIAALLLVVMLVKLLLTAIVCYVFFDMGMWQMCVNQYVQLLLAVTFVAYPLVAFCLFVGELPYMVILIVTAVLLLFFNICLVIKLFRIFFSKILACFYILLYLCTLEWLPLYILAAGTKHLLNA